MKKLWIVVVAAAVMSAAPVAAENIKVGTFHKPSIVVAYYRSQLWSDILGPKMAEQAAAKKANDTKKVEDLEKWGQGHQEIAHQQLTGEAPITNILEALRPAVPEIARKAQVEIVVVDLAYAGSTVETVDVTGLLLDWLKADERTRKIVGDLRK